jgi:hypothetical protein
MPPLTRNVIALTGADEQSEQGNAGEAGIWPGMTTQGTLTVTRHLVAGGDGARTFALERQEMGQGINVPYSLNDRIKVGSFDKGDRVYAFIASGQNVALDAFLTSNGDGTLKVAGGTDVKWGKSVEANNNTTGSTGPAGAARCRVEIM